MPTQVAIDDYAAVAAIMQYLVQSAIGLGIRLDQTVIAWGVETEVEDRLACELGVMSDKARSTHDRCPWMN